MTMTKNIHTPGPWTAKDDTIVTDDRRMLHIAYLATQGMGRTYLANARLIAAAPELYEALVALLAEVEKFGLKHPESNTQWWPVRSVDQAKTAIAKAEGREQ